MSSLAYFLIIAVCVFLSAFFSCSETALLRLRKDEIERDIQKGHSRSVTAAKNLTKSTSRLLVTILLGNNIVNVLASSAAAGLAIYFFGPEEGILIATIIMTLILFIFAEVLPKAVAAQNPRQFAYWVSLPLYFIHQILYPLHLLFDRLIEPVIQRLIRRRSDGEESSEMLLYLARHAPLPKKEDDSPLPIITSSARAAEMAAAEIMVPRNEIFSLPIGTEPKALLDAALQERYTRIPIYRDSMDNMVGLVHLKDLVQLVQTQSGTLQGILKPILQVPPKKPILQILKEMQKEFNHMAIVKDESGATQGLLTQEDILEEIVGDIQDESDLEGIS